MGESKDSDPSMIEKIGQFLLGILKFLLAIIKWFWTHPKTSLAILVIGALIYFLSRPPGNEETADVPETSVDIVEYSEALDAFRAEWSIFGRFETWPTIIPLAKMADIAYSKPEAAEKQYQAMGFSTAIPIDSPLHTQVGYVVGGDDVVVLAFRGSDDTEDWILNINQYIHQGDDGGMHAGFATCYSTLRQEIVAAIRAANPQPKHIWITGHSLGGAVALICAYDLERYHDMKIDGLFTFGQPMVGRQQFASYLQNNLGDRYVHFVNELDGVPRLPAGFSHCGRLIWFKGGKVKTSKSYRIFSTSSDGQVDEDLEFVDELPTMSEVEFDKLQQNLQNRKDQLFPMDRVIPNETLKWEEISPELRRPIVTKLRPRLGAGEQGGQEATGEIEIDDPKLLEEIPIELQKYQPGEPSTTGLSVDPFPWKTNHGMAEYITKIEARIEKVKRKDNE